MADREAAEDCGGEHGGDAAVSGVCAEGGADHLGLTGADPQRTKYSHPGWFSHVHDLSLVKYGSTTEY